MGVIDYLTNIGLMIQECGPRATRKHPLRIHLSERRFMKDDVPVLLFEVTAALLTVDGDVFIARIRLQTMPFYDEEHYPLHLEAARMIESRAIAEAKSRTEWTESGKIIVK